MIENHCAIQYFNFHFKIFNTCFTSCLIINHYTIILSWFLSKVILSGKKALKKNHIKGIQESVLYFWVSFYKHWSVQGVKRHATETELWTNPILPCRKHIKLFTHNPAFSKYVDTCMAINSQEKSSFIGFPFRNQARPYWFEFLLTQFYWNLHSLGSAQTTLGWHYLKQFFYPTWFIFITYILLYYYAQHIPTW